jgi:hypothetical protein
MPPITNVPSKVSSTLPVTNVPITGVPVVLPTTFFPSLVPSVSPSLSSAVADDDASNDSPALVVVPSPSPVIRRRYI